MNKPVLDTRDGKSKGEQQKYKQRKNLKISNLVQHMLKDERSWNDISNL